MTSIKSYQKTATTWFQSLQNTVCTHLEDLEKEYERKLEYFAKEQKNKELSDAVAYEKDLRRRKKNMENNPKSTSTGMFSSTLSIAAVIGPLLAGIFSFYLGHIFVIYFAVIIIFCASLISWKIKEQDKNI